MKKTLSAILAILLICTLCACGTGIISPSTATEEASAHNSGVQTTAEQAETAEAPTETEPQTTEESALVEYGEPVISQWVELNADEPEFQILVPVKNVSDGWLGCRGSAYTLTDKDGTAVAEFSGADCAPLYLAPGQDGVIYYTDINRSGLDYLNPEYTLTYEAEFYPLPEDYITELEVSDISWAKNLASIEINGNLTNPTDLEFSFPKISFVIYDENHTIIGGAFTSGGNEDYNSDDYGLLRAHETCSFTTYRYWLPNDYPLEKATIVGYGFGWTN